MNNSTDSIKFCDNATWTSKDVALFVQSMSEETSKVAGLSECSTRMDEDIHSNIVNFNTGII